MSARSSRYRTLDTYRSDALDLFEPRLDPPPRGAVQHVVRVGDRLDLLAWRYFGDPMQYWRIADANPCIVPDELLEPGRILLIPPAA